LASHKVFIIKAVVLTLIFSVVMVSISSAVMKRKDRVTTFEVPTTGSIIDVNYRPEFDEWWIQCREGENVVIYTYDHKTQSWGKVIFTPKKAEDRATIPADKTRTSEPTQLPREEEKSHGQKVDGKKDSDKEQKKADKKWWDPLNLIKGAEK
jgi:hypothetical protein